MKRLLLFALVAFFGVSAQAQNKPTVITENQLVLKLFTSVSVAKCFLLKTRRYPLLTLQS